MAWSWSHTAEAYRNAKLNLADLSRENLRVIYSEWRAHDNREEHAGGFNEDAYKIAFETSALISNENLVNDIWLEACDFATCDNGGFIAWVCPFGCHTVSFDRDAD